MAKMGETFVSFPSEPYGKFGQAPYIEEVHMYKLGPRRVEGRRVQL